MSSTVSWTLGSSLLTEVNSISSCITARVSLLQKTLSLHRMMCLMKRRTSSTCTSPIWPPLGEWCHWYNITTYNKAANINWCTVTLSLWHHIDIMVFYRMYREEDDTEDLYNILETYLMQVITSPSLVLPSHARPSYLYSTLPTSSSYPTLLILPSPCPLLFSSSFISASHFICLLPFLLLLHLLSPSSIILSHSSRKHSQWNPEAAGTNWPIRKCDFHQPGQSA